MFTGIIRHRGTVVDAVRSAAGARVEIECPQQLLDGCEIGDSIAVNGCCLTLAGRSGLRASFDLAPETLERTAALAAGDEAHLEASLRAGDQIGGHLMFGHVDGVAELLSARQRGDCLRLAFAVPNGCARFLAPKGSVALAGVSLTIASCAGECLEVELIPQTMDKTLLPSLQPGAQVNFEADMLARYACRRTGSD